MENIETNNEKKNKLTKYFIGVSLFLVIIGFYFLPSFEISYSDEESIKISLIDSIFSLNSISFNPFALVALVLVSLSLIVYFFTFINLKSNFLNIISLISLILSYIFYFLITYLFPYFEQYKNITEYSVYLPTFIFFTILYFIVSLLIISNIEKENKKIDLKEISEGALMLALSLVLDKLNIKIGSSGGSINLSALPIMIYGLRFGFLKGFILSSIMYGLISNLIDGYGILTYPFDYFIGFSFYGSSGLIYLILKNKKINESMKVLLSFIISSILMFVVRMIGSSLSSIILYQYSLSEALIYNVVYIGISSLSCLIASIILVPVIVSINNRYKTKFLEANINQEKI